MNTFLARIGHIPHQEGLTTTDVQAIIIFSLLGIFGVVMLVKSYRDMRRN